MNKADAVIEAARGYVNKMAGTFGNAEREFNVLADSLAAYLNEKPHDEATSESYIENGLTMRRITGKDYASPPHAAAEREKAIIAGGVDFVMNGPGADIVTHRVPDAAAEPDNDKAWEDAQIAALKPVETAFWSRQVVEPLVFNRMLERLRQPAAETPLYAAVQQPIARPNEVTKRALRQCVDFLTQVMHTRKRGVNESGPSVAALIAGIGRIRDDAAEALEQLSAEGEK